MKKMMKHTANLAFVILMLVVLGCACPKNDDSQKPSDSKNPAEKKSKPDSEKAKDATDSKVEEDSAPPSKSTSTSADNFISLEKYNRITYGMTYLEVVDVIGADGKIIKVSPDGTVRYVWGDDFRFIMITFMEDRVEIKSQNGLD